MTALNLFLAVILHAYESTTESGESLGEPSDVGLGRVDSLGRMPRVDSQGVIFVHHHKQSAPPPASQNCSRSCRLAVQRLVSSATFNHTSTLLIVALRYKFFSLR